MERSINLCGRSRVPFGNVALVAAAERDFVAAVIDQAHTRIAALSDVKAHAGYGGAVS